MYLTPVCIVVHDRLVVVGAVRVLHEPVVEARVEEVGVERLDVPGAVLVLRHLLVLLFLLRKKRGKLEDYRIQLC